MLQILIVEDDPLHTELLKNKFSRLKGRYKLFSAGNLENATDILKKHQISAIISDIYLPDGKGTDLIYKYPDIPVIIITGQGNETLAAQIIKAGAADYIQKGPEQYDNLPKIVDNVLSARDGENKMPKGNRLHYHMPTILDSILDGIVVTDLNGEIVYTNQGAEEILEIKRDSLLGSYYSDKQWKNVGEDGNPISEKELPLYKALKEEKQVDHFEYGLANPDYEEIKWISVNASPLYDKSGTLFGAVASFRNISEKKKLQLEIKREQRLVKAIEHSSHALLIALDYEGKIVRFNEACEDISGYSFEELKGKVFWDFLIPEDEKEEVKEVFFQLRDNIRSNRFQNYWVDRNGRKSYIAWTNTTVRDEKGNFEYILGTGIDISEQKQAEDLRIQEMKNEIAALTQYAFKNTTGITAGTYGQKSLQLSNPEAFYDAVVSFTKILNSRIDKLNYRVENNDSRELKLLGQQIGVMKGKPKDVIDIYTTVLTNKTEREQPEKVKAMRNEGRLLVLELMGHLANFYRKYYTGIAEEERL